MNETEKELNNINSNVGCIQLLLLVITTILLVWSC